MKILGNRILVSKLEEPKKEGYQAVEVQDSFVYKGVVEKVGRPLLKDSVAFTISSDVADFSEFPIGSTVIFAKYSPDTQEIKHEGKDYKVVKMEDVLAIL